MIERGRDGSQVTLQLSGGGVEQGGVYYVLVSSLLESTKRSQWLCIFFYFQTCSELGKVYTFTTSNVTLPTSSKICVKNKTNLSRKSRIASAFMKSALAPDLHESVTTFVDARGLVCTISLFLWINRWVKTFPLAPVTHFLNVGRCVLASETHVRHSTT